MTPSQLVLCRRIVRGMKLRLGVVKQRLRTDVLVNDCLGLGGKNIGALMLSDADRVTGFGRVLDIIGTQAFDGWLDGVGIAGELNAISEPLTDALKLAAANAISRHLTPAVAWGAMSAAFDKATAGKASEFAVRIVLAPAPKASDTVDGDSGEFLPIHEALIIRNDDGVTCRV
jgi:hypothetical protein